MLTDRNKCHLCICILCTWIILSVADAGYVLPSQLLFGTHQKLSMLDLSTGNETIIYKHLVYNQVIVFITQHYTKGLIYASDWNHLYRISYPPLTSTAEEIMFSASGLLGIAVDEVNDHIYWITYYNHLIHRSDLDMSNTRTIIDTGQDTYPYAIGLDVSNEWIYFSLNSGGIAKCKLNGSNRNTVISNVYVLQFALDITENRIYWTDNTNFDVRSAKLDGSDVTVIVQRDKTSNNAFGIDIYNDYLYISYYDPGKIIRVDKTTGANPLTLITSNYRIQSLKIYDQKVTECSLHKKLQDEEKRSKDYVIDPSTDVSYSDESLEENWYRVISNNGDELPTYSPGVMHCGTNFPVWLNGTLPSVDEGNVTRQTCVQTSTNNCNQTIDIKIRNCDGYFVYYLQSTPTKSAFCFGNGFVKCPKGQSSESGFYPGCSSSFPAETVSVAVTPEIIPGPSYPVPGYDPTPSLLPVFRCLSKDVSNVTYVYDVYWYINGNNVTVYTNVPYDSLNITDLKSVDWSRTHKMNMKVKCAIRLRYRVKSVPGPFLYSSEFLAGIYPEKNNYYVTEGDSIDIVFISTVPVACIASDPKVRKHCEQNFYLFQPKQDKNIAACTNNIANRDILFKAHFCGISFGSLDWNKTKTLQVYGFSDGLYNQRDRSTYIRLSTSSVSVLNEFWEGIQIPDIKVTVIDKDSVLTNRLCQSYNDPHITTFDGRSYHHMDVGEFVMYRNEKGPYWVHSLLTNCGFGWTGSSCHCGIAIRSRSSLFVLRTCEKISRHEKYLLQQPITELIACDDDDLLIDHTGSTYKVTLPIGTEIEFTISVLSMLISMISIKPSIYDIQEAKGLCGVPSSSRDPSDDFTHRSLGPIHDDKKFADSWRISSSHISEQLFLSKPQFLTKSYALDTANSEKNISSRFCVCEREATSVTSFDEFNIVQCNLTESTEFCSGDSQTSHGTVNSFYTTCSVNSRLKRSVNRLHKIFRRSTNDNDDVYDFQPLTYDEDVNETEVIPQTFRNGWTEENAKQQCNETIRKTVHVSQYSDFVDLQEEFLIQSCLKDIELTGDTTFMPDTIGTIVAYIKTEVFRNESLHILKTSDGSQTLVDYITSFLCPNNCSNNGNCSLGVCLCRKEFTGDDCSKTLSTPPSNISIPFDGLCTLGTRACERTNVYGYFPSTTVWCQLNHFEIHNTSKSHESSKKIVPAEFRNMFMVSVRLGSSRRKRSASKTKIAEGYEIRLSNDGINFGDPVTIIIYHEKCYKCNAATVTCIDLGVCNSSEPTTANDKINMTVVLASVIAVIMVVVVVFVTGIICFRFKQSQPKAPFEAVDLTKSYGCMNKDNKDNEN